MDTRVQRVVLETDRHRIVGDLTLPEEGYRSRLSDYLNRGDVEFVPLTNVDLTPVTDPDRPAERRSFLAVSRAHVQLAHQLER